ncbi:hypothetical protein ZWY2020_007593 [Hordeum vulgare]|nr:hypothetical protein ZWY2020_007593 [Hordeum vulgare]
MLPEEPRGAPDDERGGVGVTAAPCGDVPVGVGRGVVQQRSTLYDSFELNAMVVRLNRLLMHGDRPRRRAPRSTSVGGWLAVPKVLLGKIKRAFLGGPRRGGGS